jgi:hypothetical protein
LAAGLKEALIVRRQRPPPLCQFPGGNRFAEHFQQHAGLIHRLWEIHALAFADPLKELLGRKAFPFASPLLLERFTEVLLGGLLGNVQLSRSSTTAECLL